MKYITSINPANQKVLKKIKVSSKKEIDSAVRNAKGALEKWKAMPVKKRAKIMKKLASLIKKDKKNLSRLVTKEVGKPLHESEEVIPYIAEFINYFADITESVLKPAKSGNSIIAREPVGVVAVISPWNYPLQVPLENIIPALLTGNTVVFKPSETTPLSGLKIMELFRKAGLPKNAVNLVVGGDETGKQLVKSDVDMVAFVGSAAAGKNIMKSSADKLHRLCLELGGKDPAIVCSDADISKAASGIASMAFKNCGQICCSIERVYVAKGIAGKFIRKAVEEAGRFKPRENLGPLVNRQQYRNFDSHIKDAVKKGAKILCGGKPAGGLFYEPAVLVNVKDSMKIMKDETFGPALPIMVVKSEAEAIKKANSSRFGLTASVWTKDIKKGTRYSKKLDAGSVGINTHGGGGYKTPWGGWKESGFGRICSREGLRQFTQTKTITVEK